LSLKHYRRIDHRHRRELVIALLATALVVVAVLFYLIASGYHDEMRAAETATRNYAAIVEARLDSTLRRVDADMQGLADSIPLAALDARAVPRFANAIQPALLARRVNFPELDSIRVIDAGGNIIYYSDEQRPAQTNISDLPHFRAARESAGDGLIFSEVVVARTTKRPGLFVIKPLRDAQGVFRGGDRRRHQSRIFQQAVSVA
jgi:C4-dicarboxylate-specific signal transduction histidine kinase